MSKTNDGGPAFPSQGGEFSEDGLSVRDYFAAKAMAAIVGSYRLSVTFGSDELTLGDEDYAIDEEHGKKKGAKTTANLAYLVADAMLKARESK